MDEREKNNLGELEFIPGNYDIESITSYILSSSIKLGLPIDVDRTQTILYYLQARYLYENKEPMFTEDIIASGKGPFVPSSIDWLSKEISLKKESIPDYNFKEHTSITDKDKNFIDEVLKTFQDLSTKNLSEKAKEEDPWKLVYKEDRINTISKTLIHKYFEENPKNTARLYGIFENLDDTDIVNQLNSDPWSNHFSGNYPKEEFSSYIKNSLKDSGLSSHKYYSINDVLGYVCDFLIYKERAVTLKELQVILFYIQKMFLKFSDKICYNEFIYKEQDSISIGNLPTIYEIHRKEIDEDIIKNKEYDFANTEREYLAEMVRIKILEKKANRQAAKKFSDSDLEIIDIVLNELIEYPGFHLLNLVQNETSWDKTKLKNVITVKNLYYN